MQGTYTKALTLVSLAAACRDAGNAARSATTTVTVEEKRQAPVILVMGTSLTAGLGIDPSQAWPAALQRRIDSAGWRYRVVNAGVSGETSAGALRRTDWVVSREKPAVLILETGGNDGLRGLDPDSLKANIIGVLTRARSIDPPPRLVLMAMEAPPNLGDAYTRRFRSAYAEAAHATGAVLVPFFLNGVAGVDSLNQADGIHPTARGADLAAANAWRTLAPILQPSR